MNLLMQGEPIPYSPGQRTRPTPVLEIGGTHVTAAAVEGTHIVAAPIRVSFERDPDVSRFLSTVALAAERLVAANQRLPEWNRWVVAIPGPFDYDTGVARFAGVGKFGALCGIDLSTEFKQIGIEVERFINDADAFALGEAMAGAGRGQDPGVYITLGTGVGSAFIRNGRCIHHGHDIPPDGHAFRIQVDGRPLEEHVSRRALLVQWHLRGHAGDVDLIAGRALQGDRTAIDIFEGAYAALARALAPYLISFGARTLVIGGSIARSWELVDAYLGPALRAADVPLVPRRAVNEVTAALIGAALPTLPPEHAGGNAHPDR